MKILVSAMARLLRKHALRCRSLFQRNEMIANIKCRITEIIENHPKTP